MSYSVYVVGSVNYDVSIALETSPQLGQTVIGQSITYSLGGKGANQAIAAHLSGASVCFIAAIGNDPAAQTLLQHLVDYGIAHDLIQISDTTSGTAIVLVEQSGENRIVVVPGANGLLDESHLVALEQIRRNDYLLVQNEISLSTTKAALIIAKQHGARTVFNASPVSSEMTGLLNLVDMLVINQHEYHNLLGYQLTGDLLQSDLEVASKQFGIDIVVTLGSNGSASITDGQFRTTKGIPVETVDTTGAGDCFCGTLVGRLAQKESLEDALLDATAASALSVTRRGASSSYAPRAEVAALLHRQH